MMRRQIERLATLSGEAFEKAFMRMMVEHHATALSDSVYCLRRAYHADMVNMCAMMIGTQADEIAVMRLWLCGWYQICDLERGRMHHHSWKKWAAGSSHEDRSKVSQEGGRS